MKKWGGGGVKRPVEDSIITFHHSCKSGFRRQYPDRNCSLYRGSGPAEVLQLPLLPDAVWASLTPTVHAELLEGLSKFLATSSLSFSLCMPSRALLHIGGAEEESINNKPLFSREKVRGTQKPGHQPQSLEQHWCGPTQASQMSSGWGAKLSTFVNTQVRRPGLRSSLCSLPCYHPCYPYVLRRTPRWLCI